MRTPETALAARLTLPLSCRCALENERHHSDNNGPSPNSNRPPHPLPCRTTRLDRNRSIPTAPTTSSRPPRIPSTPPTHMTANHQGRASTHNPPLHLDNPRNTKTTSPTHPTAAAKPAPLRSINHLKPLPSPRTSARLHSPSRCARQRNPNQGGYGG